MQKDNAVTVGTFDGVHLGHQKVLERLIETAGRKDLNSVLVTFDPHPLKVVNPDMAPMLLTTVREKLDALAPYNLDRVEVVTFDIEFSHITAESFIRDFLCENLRMREYIIGYNHGFGSKRAGSVELARRLSKELDFGFTVMEPFLLEGGKVSSSLIRKAVAQGNMQWVTRALGRLYSFRGRVTGGQGRGRGLGYPTANLIVDEPEKLVPGWGIYAVLVDTGERVFGGMMHIGPRPTFQEAWETIEIHIFDFDNAKTPEFLTIQVIDKIREIITFGTAEELQKQLANDERKGRKLVGMCRQEAHVK